MVDKNIWLFGAGKWGEKFIEEYGKALCKGFVDNLPRKQGTRFNDIFVYSYSDFKNYFNRDNDVIYITTARRNEVVMQLFEDNLHLFARVFVPDLGIVDIKNSWNRSINSQLGEDVGLMQWFRCDWFKGNAQLFDNYKGFYLDIGAYHPFAGNNTRWAYDLGWRGMNIDPNERSIKLFNIFRPDDININCGVSDKNEKLKYHIFEGAETKNSFEVEEGSNNFSTNTKIVTVRNINDILEEHHIENIDFIDIDVEGFDERIVYSFDWKKYQPKCALIEFLGQSDIEAILQTPIHKKMKEEGYVLKCFYSVTALYIKKA